jgi:hypothetical protein
MHISSNHVIAVNEPRLGNCVYNLRGYVLLHIFILKHFQVTIHKHMQFFETKQRKLEKKKLVQGCRFIFLFAFYFFCWLRVLA